MNSREGISDLLRIGELRSFRRAAVRTALLSGIAAEIAPDQAAGGEGEWERGRGGASASPPRTLSPSPSHSSETPQVPADGFWDRRRGRNGDAAAFYEEAGDTFRQRSSTRE